MLNFKNLTISNAFNFQPDEEGDAAHDNAFHLDVGSIRSVKVSKEGRRNIPKAFEIFTDDKKFILKAKDGSNAQEWIQCLSVAKAHSQVRKAYHDWMKCLISNNTFYIDFEKLTFGTHNSL